jgi:signal transduction histidine kinase
LFVVPMTLALIVICARALVDKLSVENVVMLFATTIAITFSFHDFGWLANVWNGIGFQIQPYASLIVYSAFLFTIGRRFLGALDTVENVNHVLAQRVAEVSISLRTSEEARRVLEVSNAVESERMRLMGEIHDGIGSNLITALSVAERKQESPDTIAILRRSITDLKIAVDSLEPIEGDVVSLLANFRHRIEPDLHKAGVSFVWQVENAPILPWLDAVGALHVLRILQEVIANILSHSGATIITVVCGPVLRDGNEGVLIQIGDNGKGFNASGVLQGRGIANMRSRATSLHAQITINSVAGDGAKVSLWFPVERRG